MKGTSDIQNLLLDYSRIEKTDYKGKVKFYEAQRSQINELLVKDKFELDVDYACALFELGRYQKSLGILDTLIEFVIRENIFSLEGENIFHILLFKKSACHYNLGELDKSKHVLQELIKMDSENTIYETFFKRCYRSEYIQQYRWMGGVVVGLFLLAAFIISIELLIIRPFYFESAGMVEFSRNAIFIFAILVLAVRELIFHQSFTKKLSFLKK